MAEWIEIIKKQYLSTEDMNAIYNNFICLQEYLSSLGYFSHEGAIEIADNSVSYDIPFSKILDKFNIVEKNIQTLHYAFFCHFDAVSNCFKKYRWTKYPQDLKKEVWRWIDWLNLAKSHLPQWDYLYDINGELITDANGEALQILTTLKEEN